ncbi:MAG: molybdenum cofactor biosynthesis protein MoeB, partial [Synechococcaceae bacterium WB8_3_299]|nr:molybdenum cofactor biosynthesis protein MoeB [Synechococcaceae bacterium WB8_3_299]
MALAGSPGVIALSITSCNNTGIPTIKRGSGNTAKMASKTLGRLGIVDFDVVDHSNLQRQVIHGTSWVGK